MLTKTLLIAGSATALMSGAAMAQQDNPHSALTVNPVPADQTVMPARPADQAQTGALGDASATVSGSRDDGDADASLHGAAAGSWHGASANTGSQTDTSATMPAAGSLTLETVTNGPVPDTRENRAKYGMPMSHAGKMTSARGN